jgi:hypothetical protein
MPRYFFHLRSPSDSYDDTEGCELDDDEAALGEARAAACELTADRLRRGLATAETVFEVQDADGTIVGTVLFPKTCA